MEDEPLYRLIMPDGMHLANPQDDPSVYLGAFFDDENHLKGQARWEPVFDNTDDGDGAEIGNDDGDTPAAAMAAAAIAIAAIVGTAYYLANNETFRSWWDKTVVHWWEDSIKLDIENPIIRINTAFKGCSSLEKISVLPRIYHN